MVLHYIFLAISIILSVIIFIISGLYTTWYWYFIPVLGVLVIYIAIFLLFVLYLVITSLFLSIKKEIKKPKKYYYYIVTSFLYIAFKLLRIKIVTNNLDTIPDKRCLIISNHQSSFDPMLLLLKTKNKPLICITKPENLKIPVAGPYLHKAGFIAINRENNFEAAKAIAKATNFIKNDYSSIYICPEGTRNKNGGLLPFHAGSYKIAYKSECPIVITSVNYTKNIFKKFIFAKKTVTLNVLKVLEYEEYKNLNTQQIADYSRNLILEDLKEE